MKKIVSQLARRVGLILLKEFKSQKRVAFSDKYQLEIITKFDFMAERIILKEIRKQFPSHDILSEEAGFQKRKSDYVWVVDPLDGTMNFTIKNPIFSVSIGLVYRNQPIFGVVYFPIRDEMYVAEKDRGATLNNKTIWVSTNQQLSHSFLTFCHGHKLKDIKEAMRLYQLFKLKGREFRQLGSAAIECCYVACGRTDAIIIPGAHSWDVAAGTVIVREAGGQVTDFQGRDWTLNSKSILATNRFLHQKLLPQIKKCIASKAK